MDPSHGAGARWVVRRREERPVALAQQHRDVVDVGVENIKVSHRQVESPIAIEITHGHGPRLTSSRVVHRRLERSVAVAQQHRDVVGTIVRHHQVELPIAIEVANGHGL